MQNINTMLLGALIVALIVIIVLYWRGRDSGSKEKPGNNELEREIDALIDKITSSK